MLRARISACHGLRTVGRVVNGDNDAGSKHNLLPGLANVDHIDTVGARLPQVRLHVHLEVLGTEMALGRQEHLDVLGRRVEDRGKVAGSHLDGLAVEAAAVVRRRLVASVFEKFASLGGEDDIRAVRASRIGNGASGADHLLGASFGESWDLTRNETRRSRTSRPQRLQCHHEYPSPRACGHPKVQ